MICKYKDLCIGGLGVEFYRNPVLTEKSRTRKYCLHEELGSKRPDYKNHFRSRCLFSIDNQSERELHRLISLYQTSHTNKLSKCDFPLKLYF